MSRTAGAVRRTGSNSPNSSNAPRRQHTPRSHVFSGLPPPAIQTVNLQRSLDEAKAQVAELTQTVVMLEDELAGYKNRVASTDALPEEPTDMTKGTMFKEQTEFLAGLSKAVPRVAPDRYNATLSVYCEDLQRKLLQQSTEIMNLNTELAKLKHVHERGDGRGSVGDAASSVCPVDMSPTKASLTAASAVTLDESPNSAIKVSSAVIVSTTDKHERRLRAAAVVGGTTAALRSDRDTATVVSAATSMVSITSAAAAAVHVEPHAKPTSPPLTPAPIPNEVLDKLRHITKVTGQAAAASYVKQLLELCKTHGLVDGDESDKKEKAPDRERGGASKGTSHAGHSSPVAKAKAPAKKVPRAAWGLERSLSSGSYTRPPKTTGGPSAAAVAATAAVRARSRSPQQ